MARHGGAWLNPSYSVDGNRSSMVGCQPGKKPSSYLKRNKLVMMMSVIPLAQEEEVEGSGLKPAQA